MKTRFRRATFAAGVMIAFLAPSAARAQNRTPAAPIETPAPIRIPRLLQIHIQPMPAYGPAPLTVGFLVGGLNPNVTFQSFRWNFGDGQVSTLPPTALFHTYTKPGSYVVTVTATTSRGRVVTALGGVIVTAPSH